MRKVVAIALGVLVVVAASAIILVHHYTSTRYIRGRLARSIARSTEHLYRIRIGSSDVSLRRHSLKLSNVELLPDTAELKSRIQNGRSPATRVAFTVSSLTLEGVDLWALVRGGLVARSAVIDSPRVMVHVDRKIAALAGPTRSRMPHEVLAATRRAIRIDTLRVAHGDVRYSELALVAVRPGTMRFADLSLTACNITNRRDPKRRPIPAVAQIHCLLAGAAPAEAHIAYDLFSPALYLTYDGTVGRMDLQAFNETLVDLEGYRVTEGYLDSTRFQFSIDHDVAAGEMEVLYHDLKISIVDRATHKSDLSQQLKSAINNEFRLRQANPRDAKEPPLSISVRCQPPPDASFLRLLWSNIRYGLVKTIAS
jgi:hypothetical protein